MQTTPIAMWGLAVLILGMAAGTAQAAATPPLVDAVRQGDVNTVRTLVKQTALINEAQPDGTTALHWAADRDDLTMARLLVRAGANVKAANRYGFTPIYAAAVNGNAAMLELLIEAGVDVNTVNPEGETVLMTAARTGNAGAIRTLLARGANVHAREKWKKQTALMWAAHEGNAEAAQLLLDAGANVHDRSIFGFTPLIFAARQGRTETLSVLLAHGANVNDTLPDGTSALVTAIQSLCYEAAVFLLEHGVDPNASAQGWTALHQVVWSRRPQRGQNNPGQRPQGNVSSAELAAKLVEYGANVNARLIKEPTTDQEGRNSMNRIGATPLLLAAKSCDVPMMEVLIGLGGDPFLGTIEGTTPLMAAAGVGVFSRGESPGEPEESAQAVKLLLDLGATVDDVDKNGETVMHGPAWRGSNEAVTLLVNAGARLNARNSRGWMPLTIADGVYFNARVVTNPHTAKLIRELMEARGLDTRDVGIDIGGALRPETLRADEVDAQTPSDVQRKLLEAARQRAEQLKALQQEGK